MVEKMEELKLIYHKTINTKVENITEVGSHVQEESESEWTSPSDAMLGLVNIKAPFTTRYVRGEVHKGILNIGDDLMAAEHELFMRKFKIILEENNDVWSYIIEQEKKLVKEKAVKAHDRIFHEKSQIMSESFFEFYETTLQELENHMRIEHEDILLTTHSELMSRINVKIKADLQREREKLERVLQEEYDTEVRKLREYYFLLMKRENIRSTDLINKATRDRDEALTILYKQMEMQNISESMFIICSERKRCHIKKFLLENYCDYIEELNVERILEKGREYQRLQEMYISPGALTKQWQDKICNILRMFLRFISFTLKLIPEQTTFLMLFEKMVILQLNEIIKVPGSTHSIVLDEADSENIFNFFGDSTETKDKTTIHDDPAIIQVSEKKPFVIYGDFTKPEQIIYGSCDTLPLDVDLPVIVIDRKHFYAKCHNFQDIKLTLQCKCKKSVEAVCQCAQSSLTSLRLLECTCKGSIQAVCRCGVKSSTSSRISWENLSEEMSSIEVSPPNSVNNLTNICPQKGEISLNGEDESVQMKPCSASCKCSCIEKSESINTINEIALAGFHKIDYCPRRKCNHWLKLVPSYDNALDFDFDPVKFRRLINELALETVNIPMEPGFDETLPRDDHFVLPEEEPIKNLGIQCSIGNLPIDDQCPCCEFEIKKQSE